MLRSTLDVPLISDALVQVFSKHAVRIGAMIAWFEAWQVQLMSSGLAQGVAVAAWAPQMI